MSKLNMLLLAALLLSCLLLVRSAYESRRVFAALDKARGEQQNLDAEFRRLDTDRQKQAANEKVDRVAREQLRMHTALPGQVQQVLDPAVGQPIKQPQP
jgi:cell division protein FtsL